MFSKKNLDGIAICRVATVPFSIVSQLLPQIYASRKAGMDITLVSSPGAEIRQVDVDHGLRHVPIPIERSIHPPKDLLSLFRLYRFFRKGRFRIVHSITPKGGLLTAIAARLAGVPLRLHTFTGQPWVTKTGIVRWLSRSSDILMGRLNTYCYADSLSQRQFLIDENILPPERIGVLGRGCLAGVDLKRFDASRFDPHQKAQLKESLGVPEEGKVIIFVGRITQDKGIDELLEAFAAIRQRGIEASLLLVGPLDAEIGGDQKKTGGLLQEGRGVYHVGYSERVEHYLSIADLICLPSYREGFGTVIVEAAAMGIPAVASRIYGLTDAVIDGQTGLLVPPQNSLELEKALTTLLQEPGLLERMGQNARLQAHHFAQERINREMLKEYVRLIEEDSRRTCRPAVNRQPAFLPGKRLFDIILAATLVTIAALPMAVIALLIKLTSKGPVLYWSDRIGRYNTVFRMPKFRTMAVDTPEVATDRLINAQDYTTSVGRFLRKTSLDELPQLFSILEGKMSLVGPRPALFNQYELIRERSKRGIDRVMPGITGWAQVNGRDDISDEKKIGYDAEYCHNHSFWIDLQILLKTIINVVERKGVRH
jgi:lipopolysaccharide/colanic/teichoic acid biosynthesis glycosyltransferase/glycosyltransferase involved in cell wall biosynthesis